MTATIFHLSLPVNDLAATRQFYCSVLGALPGRSTDEWIDVILFGHQVTFHQQPEQVLPTDRQGVRHFGTILDWTAWEALCAAVNGSGYPVLLPPTVIAAGSKSEHGKLLLRDPSGNLLEFKAYRDLATVLPGNRVN